VNIILAPNLELPRQFYVRTAEMVAPASHKARQRRAFARQFRRSDETG
jgi:hypothetical protein